MWGHREEILSAISTIYDSIIYLDLKKGTYEVIKGHMLRKKKGKLCDISESVMDQFIDPGMKEEVREFFDLQTLASRLKDKESIVVQYRDYNKNWYQGRVVVKKRAANGTVLEVLYIVRNCTEEKSRELTLKEELKETAKRAEHANQSKTIFLQRMSHDIRTPLNGIVGMIQIAQMYEGNKEKWHDCEAKMMYSAQYLLELVDNVLDVSKLENGELALEHRPFDIVELMTKAYAVAESYAKENAVYISDIKDTTRVTHRHLIGSPLHLKRILLNLASNAVKYNRVGGSIKLSCKELGVEGKNATYQFICEDTGLGMSESFIEHAFEPFSQEGKKTLTSFSGSGLGLSIVKEIVDLMHGTIELESKENVGSTFRVTLTFEIGRKPTYERKINGSDEQKNFAGKTAILAEDNELNMEIAKTFLEREGIAVTCARDGKEAVEKFEASEEGTYDFIFMDVMMPVMDGLAATRTIRALNRKDAKTVSIIAVTANAFAEDKRVCYEAGMDAHIAKPIDVYAVRQCLFELLQEKKRKKKC